MHFSSSKDACYIFGYGSEEVDGDPTLDLRLASVVIISQERCLRELGPTHAPELDSGMFCAIGEDPFSDACSVSCIKCHSKSMTSCVNSIL